MSAGEHSATGVRLLLLGAPASGKGTQGQRLSQTLGIPKVSTGDMLRAARDEGSELGKLADGIMAAGKLVPDDLVIRLVAERLRLPDARNGFILDGFPRTLTQAQALDEALQRHHVTLTAAICIDLPRELLMERATLRRTDVQTGQIYHLKYNPPPVSAQLVHRDDDREETVRKRVDAYDTMTAPLLPYYQGQSILRRVDGAGTPEQVSARIDAVLQQLNVALGASAALSSPAQGGVSSPVASGGTSSPAKGNLAKGDLEGGADGD
jgi:adenylate kinase